MELRILGWESKGLRCPDAELSFNPSDRTDFIQMNNGTGKTTTLLLLQIALTGVRDVSKITDGMQGDEKDLERSAHDLINEKSEKGTFKLHTKISGDEYTFELDISKARYGMDTIKIKTTAPNMNDRGMNAGWHPPEEAKVYLSLNFVQVFVFNGEKAAKLFTANDSAKKTIDTLCQFNILDESKGYVDKYVTEVGELNNTGAGAQGTETRLRNRRTQYTDRLLVVIEECKVEKKAITTKDHEIKKIEEWYKNEINKEKKRKDFQEKHDKDIKENTETMLAGQRLFYEQLINPMKMHKAIKKRLLTFKENLTKCKLPEDVASQWFDELSELDNCICGTPIGPKEKKSILATKKDYLDDEVSGILNSIKNNIGNHANTNSQLSDSLKAIMDKDKQALTLTTKYDRFIASLGEKDEKFKKDYEKVGKLKLEVEQHEVLVKEYEAPGDVDDLRHMTDSDELLCIKTISNICDELKKQIDEISRTTNLRNASSCFSEIIDETRKYASNKIHAGIVNSVQNDIDKILKDAKPPIKIIDIKNKINLNRSKISSGQQLSTAYIFILSALKYSELKVPFIVDSPCGAIDDVKRVAIAKTLPLVTEQFITFITPTERDYFANPIKDITKGKCSYTTIFWLDEDVIRWIKNNNISKKELTLKENWGMVKGYKGFEVFNLADKSNR